MHDRPSLFPYGDGDEDEDPAWQSALNRLRHVHQPPEPDEGESPRFRPGKGDLIWPCPSCESFRTEQRHIARRIWSAIGAAAGATSGAAAVLSGAETGAVAGALGGPFGAVCGGVAGAVLAGLVAGAAGCATGAAFGEALDHKVLNNWRCLACGRTFTVRPS
ncbi:glycine zipper family protein [Burkholderia sp. MSMB1498]|uniref:glycine zipper family protein n=1 Tax=Burkholderia sp. MSMB1498 TaxID=1637842 RepID=UPI0009E7B282|nr:glycine zipper family protein [Burkholderia sp. MSMB1498]